MDWPNYPADGTNPYETVLPPGQTLDLPFILPAPVCAPTDEGPVGLVSTNGGVVRAPLDASGRDFLHRIWQRECTRKSVTDHVSLAFGNEWHTLPHGGTLALAGTLNLERVQGADRVDVIGFEGSVLRCDPHARAESKQTFLFRVEVRVGDDPPVRVIVMPDRATQVKALDLLDKVCG